MTRHERLSYEESMGGRGVRDGDGVRSLESEET